LVQARPEAAPVRCGRHRPEQTTLYCLVRQQVISLIAQTEAKAPERSSHSAPTQNRYQESPPDYPYCKSNVNNK
jgi:hypothetical protein